VFLVGLLVGGASMRALPVSGQAQETLLSAEWDVRFDGSASAVSLPLPIVPKDWKFIGVSNGEKLNSNNLWFEGRDGQVYLLSGFTTQGVFILNRKVYRLNRR
jgi:hypothetical protein